MFSVNTICSLKLEICLILKSDFFNSCFCIENQMKIFLDDMCSKLYLKSILETKYHTFIIFIFKLTYPVCLMSVSALGWWVFNILWYILMYFILPCRYIPATTDIYVSYWREATSPNCDDSRTQLCPFTQIRFPRNCVFIINVSTECLKWCPMLRQMRASVLCQTLQVRITSIT